jgi:hypothetical protein
MVEMALANPKRTRKPTPKVLAAKVCGIQKRCSPRLQRNMTIRCATDLEAFERQTGQPRTTFESVKLSSSLIDESAFDSSMDEETESDELVALSGDNIEYHYGDQLDRRDSYDSRQDSGNEDYELDDFVVGDDEDDSIFDVGSEITVTFEDSVERRLSHFSIAESSIAEHEITTNKVSLGSLSSGSGLFVSDPNDRAEYIAALSPPGPISQPALVDISPADLAEEIMDATCRFSRRCNRDSAPLRLVLSREMLEDKEVVDALQNAIKQELGMIEDIGNDSVLVVVGPKS